MPTLEEVLAVRTRDAHEARDFDESYERRQRVAPDPQESLSTVAETNERRLDIPTFVRRMIH